MTTGKITKHQTDIPVESLYIIASGLFAVANCVRQALPAESKIPANMGIARDPDSKDPGLSAPGPLPAQQS